MTDPPLDPGSGSPPPAAGPPTGASSVPEPLTQPSPCDDSSVDSAVPPPVPAEDLQATRISENVPVLMPGDLAPGDWSTEPLWPHLTDFRIVRQIGEGAMGAVFKARQISTGRRVAVKVIFPHLARSPKVIERFYREARTMGLLEHPNIVQAYAVGEENGYHYLAMEYVNGRSVQTWLLEAGRLSVGDAVHITLACARALEHAHRQGLVHRDIKPDNILITRAGDVKLTDFGMVKLGLEDVSITQTGHAVGTPAFMPLEQARNSKESDGRSDIYALGCTLYCMLTGQPPFRGPTLVEMIQAKELGTFPPARRGNPNVPERLDLIVYKMTAKSMTARYQTCGEVVRDLAVLGLASPSLSFVLPRINTPTPMPATLPAKPLTLETAEAPAASAEAGATSPDTWFLRYRTHDGGQITVQATTQEILERVADESFDLTAKASRRRDDGYEFLVSIREFRPVLLQRVTRSGIDRKTGRYRAAFRQLEEADRKRRDARRPRRGLRDFVRDWQTELLILLGIVGSIGAFYLLKIFFFERIWSIFVE